MRCALLFALSACGFQISTNAASGDDGTGTGDDGGVANGDATQFPDSDLPDAMQLPDGGIAFDALHVPTTGDVVGTQDLVFASNTTIDTGTLSIGTPLPSGVTFDMWPQTSGGELAVLHVGRLLVPVGVTVRVIGSRPLVVISAGEIVVNGSIDVGARRDVPGAGGSGPGMGAGKGNDGQHAGNYNDSGASGGSFGSVGGAGGSSTACASNDVPITNPGSTYGSSSLDILVGGSGGGNAFNSTCGLHTAGAGGGAIQLSSATRVTISGGVNAGGGGGGAGLSLKPTGHCDMAAGSGGGSGGAIVLQSPRVEILAGGAIAANGGGGGSSGGDPNGQDDYPAADGGDGNDGGLATMGGDPGGDVGTWSSAGGRGGGRAGASAAGANATDCNGNGGGGGGGVGRIVVATSVLNGQYSNSGTDSPVATSITY